MPNTHEPALDDLLINELNASIPTYLEDDQIEVVIQAHFLGSRAMYQRKEVADIALFATVTRDGQSKEKVALIQTKRLYPTETLERPLDPKRRHFSFDANSKYEALEAASRQMQTVDLYRLVAGLPVYYGFYNPLQFLGPRPSPPTPSEIRQVDKMKNHIGCRILTATQAHAAISLLDPGLSPSYYDLKHPGGAPGITNVDWRLETFVAEEFLPCRQGTLVNKAEFPQLYRLLQERDAPHLAEVKIKITDMRSDSDRLED